MQRVAFLARPVLEGRELQRVPIAGVRQVVVFGNVQLSTQALETLATCEVPVVYLTRWGRFVASLEPAPTKNVMLRRDQYRVFADPAPCKLRMVD